MSYIYQYSDPDLLFQLNLIHFNNTPFCILCVRHIKLMQTVCVYVLHLPSSSLQLWNGLQLHLGSTLIVKDYYHKNVKT